jgi:hypothetical protein
VSGRSASCWLLAVLGLPLAVLGLPLASLALPAAGAAHAGERPPRADPAARLLPFEQASDVWDLTVLLERGHWIVAQATISNLGPGDRTAAVVGHVIDPEGGTHEFHKIRREGAWQLSADRRRLDLDAILFDQADDAARFYVSKKRVDLDLRIDLSGEQAWPEAADGGDAGFDLLALAAPVEGTLQLRGAEALSVRGRAFLTHRWMPDLEAQRVARRVELFAIGSGVGLYFVEVTPPAGKVRRWLVAGRDGRIWRRSDAVEVRYASGRDGDGLHLEGPGISGRAGLDRILLRDEPLSRAPWLARWWYGRHTRPRFVWSAAPFEFTVHGLGAEETLRISGHGLVEVARFDPGGATPSEEKAGWGER